MTKATATSEATLAARKVKLDEQLAVAAKKRREIIKLQREMHEQRKREAACVIGEMIIALVGDGDWRNIDYEKLLHYVRDNQANMTMDFLTPQTVETETAVVGINAARDVFDEVQKKLMRQKEGQCEATYSQNQE